MASEIFLTIDGIKGESTKAGAEQWIEIFSFSNGASNPSSVSFGTGSGAGKVDISSINFQKQLGGSSPYLFAKCCSGTHTDKGPQNSDEPYGQPRPEQFEEERILSKV